MIDNVNIERLGRIVRDVFVDWAKKQPNPKPNQLIPWQKLPECDKEPNRLIGVALASYGIQLAQDAALQGKYVCKICFAQYKWQSKDYCVECWIKKYDVFPEVAKRLREGEYLHLCNCCQCKRKNQSYCNRCM